MKGKKMIHHKNILTATFCVTAAIAAPAAANDELYVSVGLGFASVGAEIAKSGGGTARTEDMVKLVPNATLGYNFGTSANGWKRAIEGNFQWIDERSTFTDTDLGNVAYDVDWSATVVGKFGKDFGVGHVYGLAGFALTDANLSTHGNTLSSVTRTGIALGAGYERQFNNGWAGSASFVASAYPEDAATGGGGDVSYYNSTINFGISKEF